MLKEFLLDERLDYEIAKWEQYDEEFSSEEFNSILFDKNSEDRA
ncbi:hypothetical protein JOC36_001418 [Weissella uvarum]|nr:hypothetical protein [Weissella uvarum]MBM7617841.1 hypothetical protein [Weissella uvarum]